MSNILKIVKTAVLSLSLFIAACSTAFSQSDPDSNAKGCVLKEADMQGWNTAGFMRSNSKIERNYLYDRFSQYDPNYYVSNFGQPDFGQVKFQISFKYDLGFNFRRQIRSEVFKDHIYFAYTQVVFVDLYNYSSPTRDINFTPILTWEHRVRARQTLENKRCSFFLNSYAPGVLHQSNGGSAANMNRSVYKAFLNVNFLCSFKKGEQTRKFRLVNISISPQAWFWPKDVLADSNRNIAEYQGYGKVVTVLNFDFLKIAYDGIYPLAISNTVIPSQHSSTSFDLIINPLLRRKSWLPYIFLQYWYGYGESLANYDNRYNNYKPENIFRIGLQFRSR